MIKRQEGYVLCHVENVPYLLPYGQKIADQQRGIRLNETGELLWQLLEEPCEINTLARRLAKHYEMDADEKNELYKDVEQFVHQLTIMGVVETEFQRTEEKCTQCIDIAGIRIRFYGPEELLPDQFRPFFTEQSDEADQEIEIIHAVPNSRWNGKILLRNSDLTVTECGEGYMLLFPGMKNIQEARMTRDGGYVRMYCLMSRDQTEQENIFHAVRLFYLYLAQRKGYFAVHSASILYRDKAWLFSGHSGMGKTTHTNLWHELLDTALLNGDLNLIGKEGEVYYVYGIPWCGTSGIFTTEKRQLGGIVLLGRSEKDHIEELEAEEKTLRVMQRMISPSWTAELMRCNLEFAGQMAERIPVYHLLCTKNPSAVYTIKERMDHPEAQS